MIRASIVLAIACCAVPWLRRRSAAERHLAWTVALGAAAVLPLLAAFMPSWQPAWARQFFMAFPTLWIPGIPGIPGMPWAPSAASGGDVDVVVRAVGIESTSSALSQLGLACWLIGTAISLLTLALQAVRLARYAARAEPVGTGRLATIAADVRRSLGLNRPIGLLRGPTDTIPATWGARHPRIMLPSCAVDWSDDRLHAVLAHEMAHIRRNDPIVHLLAEVACAVYWFHPLFWIAKRGASRESEQAADDVVLELGVEGGEYAGHLLEIVRAAHAPMRDWSPAVAMASSSPLERRFAALLNALADRRGITRRKAALAAAITLLLAVPLATIGLRGAAMNIIIRTDLPPLAEGAMTSPSEQASTAVRSIRVVAPRDAADPVQPEIVEYTTPPLYSDEARSRGVEGIVTVAARVERDGHVSAARVARGLGAGLDQNALVALRQWRFLPGSRGGVPMAMDVEIDVEFSLRNEAVNALIANDMATRVGPGVTPPSAVRVFGLWPRHPKVAGTVILDVILLEDGAPKIIRILQSLDPELDESAIRNFERWRFSPALKNGRPVKVRMNAEVSFHG